MPCYHPMTGVWYGEYTERGKKKYTVNGFLNFEDAPSYLAPIPIPCGVCLGCKLDYSRSWADRMMLELDTAKTGIFVTLTYDNDHVPIAMLDDDDYPAAYTLYKKDCQDFMKRLRGRFEGKKIRFYLSGEYGERTLRPHYHAILFGLSLDDFPDRVKHGTNELGQKYYISKKLEEIWSNGHVILCDVSWKTCAYVSRYVTKKQAGLNGFDFSCLNAQNEFALMSRKPGIGRMYLDEHPDCLDYANINLSTPEGGLKIGIPKYFLKQLELTDPERYDKIMKERREFASDAMILKLQKTGLGYLDYLEVMEQNKIASVKSLKRDRVERR